MTTFQCIFGPCSDWTEIDGNETRDVTVAEYLEKIVYYKDGEPDHTRHSLWFMIGGGLLQCPPDSDGLASGDDCVYLYPDLNTALTGRWRSGRMMEAVEASLTSVIINDHQLELNVVKSSSTGKYELDQSSSYIISQDPLLEDPLERKSVYVAASMIDGAGEGLFLRRDAEAGDLVSVYNGVRMTEHESRIRKEDRRSVYRIYGWSGEVLNIPTRFQSTHAYTASLAHKINHADDKTSNAEFRILYHPRFGECVGVYMTRPGMMGEEVLVNYGYVEKAMAMEGGMDMMLRAAQVRNYTVSGFINDSVSC